MKSGTASSGREEGRGCTHASFQGQLAATQPHTSCSGGCLPLLNSKLTSTLKQSPNLQVAETKSFKSGIECKYIHQYLSLGCTSDVPNGAWLSGVSIDAGMSDRLKYPSVYLSLF